MNLSDVMTIPTIGFNVEQVDLKNVRMTAWDLGGRGRVRALHRLYYEGANGIIFCLDSNDRERIPEVVEELQKTLAAPELAGLPLLVYANKQDLPNALNAEEIAEKLELRGIANRPWCTSKRPLSRYGI